MKYITNLKTSLLAMFTFMSVSASAALSTEEQAVFDVLTEKVSDLSVVALGVLAALLGIVIGMKLLKKFASKAT